MKNVIAAAGLGAAVAIGSLAGAGTASANTTTFLSALHSAGWYSNENGDASLVNNGRLVCEMLDNGNTQWAVTNAVYQHTDSNVDWADAQEFVRVAEIHLCW